MSDIIINGTTYNGVEGIQVKTTNGETATYTEGAGSLYNHLIDVVIPTNSLQMQFNVISTKNTAVTTLSELHTLVTNNSDFAGYKYVPAVGYLKENDVFKYITALGITVAGLFYCIPDDTYARRAIMISSSATIKDAVIPI